MTQVCGKSCELEECGTWFDPNKMFSHKRREKKEGLGIKLELCCKNKGKIDKLSIKVRE